MPRESHESSWKSTIELAGAKLPTTLEGRRETLLGAISTRYEPIVAEVARGEARGNLEKIKKFRDFLTQPEVPWPRPEAEGATRGGLTREQRAEVDAAIGQMKSLLTDNLSKMASSTPPARWPEQNVIDALAGNGNTIDEGDFVITFDWVTDPGNS
ncbi:MAG: hypothetical protein AAGI53_02665 [Planctomycetota bacterium]